MLVQCVIHQNEILGLSREQKDAFVRQALTDSGFDLERHIGYRQYQLADGSLLWLCRQIRHELAHEHAGQVYVKSDTLDQYVRIGRIPRKARRS